MLIVVATLVLAAAGFVVFLFWTHDLKEELIAEANTSIGVHRPRPTHVEQVAPGDFGEILNEHLPPMERAWREIPSDEHSKALVTKLLDGERPMTELPEAYRQALEQLRPHVDAVLAATHTASVDLRITENPWQWQRHSTAKRVTKRSWHSLTTWVQGEKRGMIFVQVR